MNKKLLLVSLLAVGMLVGCGGKKDDSSSSVTPSENSSSGGGGETSSWSNTYGNAGYYLIGTGNDWSELFWTKENFEIFYLSPVGDGTYTLTGSIAAEDLVDSEGAATKWEYKVRYFDGEGKVTDWYPDGVDNNNAITEAGQYTFTFNPNGLDGKLGTKPDGSTFQLYTEHVKAGDAKTEDHLKISATQRSDLQNVTGDARLRLYYTGTEITDNDDIYIYGGFDGWTGWTKLNKTKDEDTGRYTFETTYEDIVIGIGPLEMSYEFCIVVGDADFDLNDPWNTGKQLINPDGGNWSVSYTSSKTLSILTLPENIDNLIKVMTVEEAIAAMKATDFVGKTVMMRVRGEVTAVSYNSTYGSYTLDLAMPEPKEDDTPADGETEVDTNVYKFQVYSGVVKEGEAEPKVGDTVSAYGYTQIFTKTDSETGVTTVTYEVAYDSTNKVSPIIYNVVTPFDYLYVRGDMSNWACQDAYKLVATDTPDVYACTVSLAEGALFKLSNNTDNWEVQYGGATANGQLVIDESCTDCFDVSGDNITVLVAGSYTFTYDLSGETPVASVSK